LQLALRFSVERYRIKEPLAELPVQQTASGGLNLFPWSSLRVVVRLALAVACASLVGCVSVSP
jgi:hypothetical protein